MLISSDNPDLPTDIIDLKSQERSSFKRQNPVLVWNCLVTYQDCSTLLFDKISPRRSQGFELQVITANFEDIKRDSSGHLEAVILNKQFTD